MAHTEECPNLFKRRFVRPCYFAYPTVSPWHSPLPDIHPFLNVFHQTVSRPSFGTLEPPPQGGRLGGRGKKGKKSSHKRQKRTLGYSFFAINCFFNMLLHSLALWVPGGLARLPWWKNGPWFLCLGFGPALKQGFPGIGSVAYCSRTCILFFLRHLLRSGTKNHVLTSLYIYTLYINIIYINI